MIDIFYFTGSEHSRVVAEFFAKKTRGSVKNLLNFRGWDGQAERAIVVFPVYCQNIPLPVKRTLPLLKAKYLVLIATYGSIAHGNVLWEAAKIVNAEVIAAAYVPMGHTFLANSLQFNGAAMGEVLNKLEHPIAAKIGKERKNLFSDFFPAWRSRIGVKLKRTAACNNCNLCTLECPVGAISNGKVNKKCIRCLRCVSVCPRLAWQFKLRPILKHYLNRPRNNKEIKIYL